MNDTFFVWDCKIVHSPEIVFDEAHIGFLFSLLVPLRNLVNCIASALINDTLKKTKGKINIFLRTLQNNKGLINFNKKP